MAYLNKIGCGSGKQNQNQTSLFCYPLTLHYLCKRYETKEENREDVRRIGWVVLVLATMLTLPFIGMGHFYTRGEPREALVAMAMLDQGNFILPFFKGNLHSSRRCCIGLWRCSQCRRVMCRR